MARLDTFYSHPGSHALITPNNEGMKTRKTELLTKGIVWKASTQIIWGLCSVCFLNLTPTTSLIPQKCSQQLAPRDKAEAFHSLKLILFQNFK